MDKFGIFNLLSSLLNGNNTNSDINASGNLNNLQPFSDNNVEEKAAKARVNSPPLQISMLLTMKSHDEFIKRVKARNTKQ